jgi:outer membrane protein assembly factor BamD (BamD/ComL family)
MSVSGISSSSLYDTQTVQNNFQKAQQEFQQLGKDLQSGNLSAAQSDFTTLQNLLPQASSTTSAAAQSNNPIAQAFAQLGKDLQSGNLSAAQSDFATIQQDFKNQASQGTQASGGHHHHHGGGSSDVSQLFDQLGQDLQSGDLSSAQQTYGALAQQVQQSATTNGLLTASTTSASPGVSVSA